MLRDAACVALLIAGATVPALLHLRHLGLVAMAVVGPLPGLGAALALFPGAEPSRFAPLAWLFSFALSLMLADEFSLRVAGGNAPWQALRGALRMRAAALAAVAAQIFLSLLALTAIPGAAAVAAASTVAVAAALASGLALFPLCAVLPYDEAFVARSNRWRERWLHLVDVLIAVARPRWGFAVSGIVLVFAVLGFFGAQPLKVPAAMSAVVPVVFSAAGLSAAVGLAFALRDWRTILSALFALAVLVLIGLWGLVRLDQTLGAETIAELCLALGTGAIGLFTSAADAGGYGRAGDDATMAAARVLVRSGTGLIFATAGPLAGLLLSAALTGPSALVSALVVLSGGAAALVGRPGLAIAIETWFPRRQNLEARYRRL